VTPGPRTWGPGIDLLAYNPFMQQICSTLATARSLSAAAARAAAPAA
jgi:hypothetical protein